MLMFGILRVSKETMKPFIVGVATLLALWASSDQVPAQQTEKILAFRSVDVFDGSRLIRNTNVIIRDGMVRAIGPEIPIPSDAEVIDGKRKTLLPGFIDAHVHLGTSNVDQFLRDALNFEKT